MRKTADRPNESAVVVDWIKNTVDAIQRIQDIDGIKQLQHNLRDQISIANGHSLKRKTVISNEVDYELEYLISQISKLSIEETKTVEKESRIMAVPNIYLYENGKCYDVSILINRDGQIPGIQKMVHVTQAD